MPHGDQRTRAREACRPRFPNHTERGGGGWFLNSIRIQALAEICSEAEGHCSRSGEARLSLLGPPPQPPLPAFTLTTDPESAVCHQRVTRDGWVLTLRPQLSDPCQGTLNQSRPSLGLVMSMRDPGPLPGLAATVKSGRGGWPGYHGNQSLLSGQLVFRSLDSEMRDVMTVEAPGAFR